MMNLRITLKDGLLGLDWNSIPRKGPDMLEAWMLFGSSVDVGSYHPVAPASEALPPTDRLTAHNNHNSYIGRRHRVTRIRHHLPIFIVTSQDDEAYSTKLMSDFLLVLAQARRYK
jgi:hypothetical protein